MRHYAKLLRATLMASLMLVMMAGAAVAGPLEDAWYAWLPVGVVSTISHQH